MLARFAVLVPVFALLVTAARFTAAAPTGIIVTVAGLAKPPGASVPGRPLRARLAGRRRWRYLLGCGRRGDSPSMPRTTGGGW